MLLKTLTSAPLSHQLKTKNQDCVDFVSSGGTADDLEMKVSSLITKLQSERVHRGCLMLECLANLAPGLPISLFVKAGILTR